MKYFLMKWSVLVLALSVLSSCGGGGGGGTTGSGNDPAAITPGSGDGTRTSPMSITVGTPKTGSIGLGGVSYYAFTAPSTGPYTVSLTGATVSVGWVLFSNSSFTAGVDSCGGYGSSTTTCYVSLTGGTTYYMMVNNYSFSSGTYYTVNVSPGGGNEGTIGAPVVLTVGAPHNATIDNNGNGYYTFTANRDGSFIISLTNTHKDLDWSLYSNATYTAAVVYLCDTTSYAGNETCSTPNLTSGQPYYLKVHNGDYADDTFTITVSNGASEGSATSPVNLTVGTTHVGGVDATTGTASGISYYRFTTDASATSSYNVLVSNVTPTANLNIVIYSDAAFSYGSIVKSCYASNQCSLSGAAASTPYYVEVRNATSSPSRTYTALVTPGGSEGSPAGPVALTVGQARNAGVDGSSSSYYSFTTLNNGAGGSYTISLANTQTNLGWNLYTDANFTQSLANGTCNAVTTAGPGDESCSTTNLDPNTTYYLQVYNAEATAGTYAVTAAAGGWSEGSKNYPLAVGALHDGSVIKYGYSYYKFTTGTSALTYVISLTNMQTNLGWWLYSDAGFSTWIIWCTQSSGTADEVCSTTGTQTGVLAANTTYYLKVENNVSGNTDSTYSLKIEPLDPAAGCSAGAGECFNFQSGAMPAAFVLTQPKNPDKWIIDAANNGGSAPGTGSSMKSGAILGGETNCVAYTRTGTSTVLFSLKTDAATLNSLVFYIDTNSVAYATWYGATAWRRVWYDTTNLVGVSHIYKWCYEKSSSTVTGADAVWVDDIEFR